MTQDPLIQYMFKPKEIQYLILYCYKKLKSQQEFLQEIIIVQMY